jgi:hypothetical protein
VAVTVAWLALALAAIAWEISCRRAGPRWTSLTAMGSPLWGRLPGRLALIALWAFVGWHVFARYTLPG